MAYNFLSDPRFPFYLVAMVSTALLLYNCVAVFWSSRRRQELNTGGSMAGNTAAAQEIIMISSFKYRKGSTTSLGLEGDDVVCAVCLGEFEEGEELRTLPECLHSFHASCIDTWLFSHPNCPLCRTDQLSH